ncbi:phage tail tape measure protein [Staphylococcus condimenti]|uniref:phage tail tape measure protein n=1 Tax=Staphylococcus condimenti TaxID=70255 RepID=UPI001023D764|nr:phage tail tape measure protein [Staphylococcus condimenti]RZI05184.1 phage tail tape measure protein [Staphylococcus condimenti]
MIKGEKAGTALRTMFTNLAKPTKAMKDEMDKLGISITDSNGEMLPMRDVMDQLRDKMGGLSKDQQAAAASTIFGKEAMSGALAVINASDEDYKKLTKSIDGSKGASKRMAKEMEGGIGGAMRKMKSAIESLAISLGDALAPMLYKTAKWITSLANKFTNLPKGIQKTIAIVGLLAAAIGPLLMVFGVMASTIGTAITVLGSLMTSMRTLSFLSKTSAAATGIWTGVTKAAALATRGLGLAIRFMTGPIGIVITAVGLLVAGITHLWRTNATFRNIVMSVWQAVQTKIMSVVGSITSIIRNNIPLIKGIFSNTFNGVRNIVNGSLNIVLGITKVFSGLFTGNFRKMWSGVQQIFSGFIRVIKGIFQASFVGQIVRLAVIMGTKIKGTFSNLGKVSRAIFSALGTWMSKKWTSIKDNTVGKAKLLWSGVKMWWSNLGKNTRATMNSIGSFMSKKWQSIKSGTVNKAKSTWSGVKSWWSNLNKNTRATMNSVGKFMSSKWSSIKSNTVNRAKNTWSGVKGAWGSLSKGTHKTMNAIGGFMSKKWKGIKSGTINLVTTMKNKVTGVMDKMGSAIKNVTGKIGGFFGGMIKGVKKGLNTLIKGVNWVGDKLGMEKLPKVKLHTGTESTHTQNFVTNGKINRDTFATVGDKGRGNGPNGFRHEAIEYPNGKMALTPNKDTTTFLPKGAKVYNGAETHSMLNGLPRFSFGTNPLGKHNPKTKKKKKGDNVFGDAWDATKAGAAKVLDGGKAVVSNVGEKAGEIVGKGKKWLKDKIGDVMDWAEKPKKLLDKVLEGFGLNLGGFGIAKKAKLPYDMMKGMYGKLKKAAVDKIKQAFEEQGGDGDGGYIDLSRGINFGFAATAAEAARQGYPFARPHHGLDINYPYGTKVYSTVSGKATGSKGYNGGFGNMMSIVSGALKVIYGHLSKLNWTGSKSVKPGTFLGLSGGDPARQGAGAGSSTGPHLHYEMQKNGVPFDPTNWLKKHNGGGSQNKSASKWKGDIKRAAKKMKVNLSNRELNGIVAQIARESNGNAGVTQGNIGDINNLRGTPAQGLLQYVPSTFKSYAVKGHKNIKNGYDQLLAFFNNSNWRRDLPYGKSGWGPSGSRRFATGGLINSSGLYNLAEGGHPEFVIPTDPSRQSDAMKLLAIASQKIEGNKKNKRPNQMRTPSTSNNNDNEMMNVMARQLEATQRQVELLTQLVASNQRLEQKPTGVSEKDMSKAQGKRAQMMAYNMGGAF